MRGQRASPTQFNSIQNPHPPHLHTLDASLKPASLEVLMSGLRRLVLIVLCASVVPLVACGDEAASGEERFSAEGVWQGGYASDGRQVQGDLTVVMNQEDEYIWGTATMTGSPCFSAVTYEGTIRNNQVRIEGYDEDDDAKELIILGVIYPDTGALEATYEVPNWGVCTGATGTMEGTRVQDL